MPIQKKAAAAPPPARKTATPPAPRGDNGGGDDGAGMSKADAFDSARPQGQIAPGKYEAVIVEMVMGKEDPEKGQSARIKVEVATEGEMQGESATQFYKVFEADGSVGKGASFLKRDLGILGYPDVKFGDIEDIFEEITEKHPGVVVTVKQNGQFTNVYINGLCEDADLIESYLATRGPF
jgi:hypothetical protein